MSGGLFPHPSVENRTCHFDGIRLHTCDHSPGHDHAASVPLAPVPQDSPPVSSLRVHWGPFGPLFSPARGRRRQASSGCARLSRAPTPLPPPTLHEGRGVAVGAPLPTAHAPAPPARSLPCSIGKTRPERWRWRVSLLAPSALCGSPVFTQRIRPGHLCHLCTRPPVCRGPYWHRSCVIAGSTG